MVFLSEKGRSRWCSSASIPHKATHTAVAVDEQEVALAELTVRADRLQIERLLKWAVEFPEHLLFPVTSKFSASQLRHPGTALAAGLTARASRRGSPAEGDSAIRERSLFQGGLPRHVVVAEGVQLDT